MANSEQFVNDFNINNTLGAAITSTTATSITVTTSTGYPTTGNFRIIVDTEIMLVTAVSGTTWTVTRGIEGTTATTHLNGAGVGAVVTAGGLYTMRSNMSQSGTYANLPSTTVASTGDVYYPTDSLYNYIRFNGTSWDHYCDGKQVFPPAIGNTWTWGNQASGATVTTTHGYSTILCPPTSNTNYNWQYVSLSPTSPYTHTFLFRIHPNIFASGLLNSYCAIVLSDGTKTMAWGAYSASSSKFTLAQWSNLTTNSGGSNPGPSDTDFWGGGNYIWMQVIDDGTNLIFNWSSDGNTWETYSSLGRTAHFSGGATWIGWGGFAEYSSTYSTLIHCVSFQ